VHHKGAPKDNINLKLISSILSRHCSKFSLTQKEFEIINEITPVRLELPIKDKDTYIKLVGKYVRNGDRGISGAYVFTNKNNKYSYVGSSISLANRLSTGYLGPKLGNRKIDLAITNAGLEQFYLDLYILPLDHLLSLDNSGNNSGINTIKLKKFNFSIRTNITS
jgi:hypothetical protein